MTEPTEYGSPQTTPDDAPPQAPEPPVVRPRPGARHAGRGAGFRLPVTKAPRKAPTTRSAALLGALTEVVVVVALALALALLIKTLLVQAFYIPSASMEQTLIEGDRVLVSKLTPRVFDLHRGDVIVFKDPGHWLEAQPAPTGNSFQRAIREGLTFVGLLPQDSGEHLIKRVIGLPGDTVACCDAKGRVTVNGVAIDEPYLYPGNKPSNTPFSQTVPLGRLWVMGDHRDLSADSRYHLNLHGGTVPIENVVGKAFVIVWPLDRVAWVGGGGDVFARVPDPPASP